MDDDQLTPALARAVIAAELDMLESTAGLLPITIAALEELGRTLRGRMPEVRCVDINLLPATTRPAQTPPRLVVTLHMPVGDPVVVSKELP